MRQEYLVQGMTCASCARNIEASLRRMPEIESAKVNFVTNRATLIIKEGLGSIEATLIAVRKTAKDIGYEFIEIKKWPIANLRRNFRSCRSYRPQRSL
ncbi:MAG: heavy-metal-associated domain-containing protein [Bdellovibrionales bacterium]|nr:heavy-metal-associated domain-containing protein [Bdellovibrionales bacterium]